MRILLLTTEQISYWGHHAHILKPIEIYKGKAIFYSLGNFAMEEVTDMLRDQATLHQDMLTSKNHMEMTAISDGFKTTKRSFPMDCYYTMVAKWEVEQGKITKTLLASGLSSGRRRPLSGKERRSAVRGNPRLYE